MNEYSILKWAAGAAVTLPNLPELDEDRILYLLGIDEEKLIALIQHHRLAPRFLSRLREQRPGWCSRSLLVRVVRLCEEAEDRFQKQLQILHEITALCPPGGLPLLTIKGVMTYALTGDSRHIRFSSDLDLFHDDLNALRALLKRIGYHEYKGKKIGGHEFAKMLGRPVPIELHRHFPVLIYPKALSGVDCVPRHHPGVWVQPLPDHTARTIHYGDLLENAVSGTTPDTCDLRVPDPNMAVLLLCAHAFGHYLHLSKLQPPIRLAELADIRDLCRHPDFHKERFLLLVEKFGGQDSVAFVGALLQHFWGTHALPTLTKSRSAAFPFPRALMFGGGWIRIQSPDDLLGFPDAAQIHSELGSNTTTAERADQRRLTSCGEAAGKGPTLPRAIIQSMGGETLPMQLETVWEEEVLRLKLTVFASSTSHHYHMLFNFGFRLLQWIDLEGGALHLDTQPELDTKVRCQIGIGQFRIEVECPWTSLPGYGRTSDSVPLLLGVVRNPNPIVTALPITILRPSSPSPQFSTELKFRSGAAKPTCVG